MSYIANSFFHFTHTAEALISILEEKFLPHYVYENYKYSKKVFAVPMVCFCDIPLTSITEHTEYYGQFAIGMKREWGEKYLNPVFYIQDNSIPYKSFQTIEDILLSKDVNWTVDMVYSLYNYLAYMKPYKGIFHKDSSKEKIFYREREWRWIPEVNYEEYTNHKILIAPKKYFDNLGKSNEQIQKEYKLSFICSDINFIIVDNELTKELFMERILKISKNIYSKNEKDLLLTKLISLDEIKDNF